jgi:hypothetical protein
MTLTQKAELQSMIQEIVAGLNQSTPDIRDLQEKATLLSDAIDAIEASLDNPVDPTP